MLKWIGGCLVLVVAGVAVAVWFGYRKLNTFAAEGPSTTATIEAPASRVFASLANADSMTEWRAEGLGIRASRRGLLAVGDTLQVQTNTPNARPRRTTWVVTVVTPNRLFAIEMWSDSGRVMATRRDSLVARGDSTLVVSTFAVPGFDSLRATRDDSGKVGGTMIGVGTKLLISAMRVQSAAELARLKARIEGKPMLEDSMPRPPQ